MWTARQLMVKDTPEEKRIGVVNQLLIVWLQEQEFHSLTGLLVAKKLRRSEGQYFGDL